MLRKTLRQLAVVLQCLAKILAQQIHVAAGIQRLGKPWTLRRLGLHLRDDALLRIAVILVAGHFHVEIHAARAGLVRSIEQMIELILIEALQLVVAGSSRHQQARFLHWDRSLTDRRPASGSPPLLRCTYQRHREHRHACGAL